MARRLSNTTPEELVVNIRKLASDGYGAHLIAGILSVGDKTVRRYAKLNGIELPKRSRKELCNWHKPRVEEQRRATDSRVRWVEWSGGRERLIDAAKRIGITTDALSHRIKKWGVELAMKLPKQDPSVWHPRPKVAKDHPLRNQNFRSKKKKAA